MRSQTVWTKGAGCAWGRARRSHGRYWTHTPRKRPSRAVTQQVPEGFEPVGAKQKGSKPQAWPRHQLLDQRKKNVGSIELTGREWHGPSQSSPSGCIHFERISSMRLRADLCVQGVQKSLTCAWGMEHLRVSGGCGCCLAKAGVHRAGAGGGPAIDVGVEGTQNRRRRRRRLAQPPRQSAMTARLPQPAHFASTALLCA